MRKAKILYKDELSGILTQLDDGGFIFQYDELWLNNSTKPNISFSFPKSNEVFKSDYLFPFFYHMLPEGINKTILCKTFGIDNHDDFGLLLNIAQHDTIGAIKVKKI